MKSDFVGIWAADFIHGFAVIIRFLPVFSVDK
jgi:hypothetical protein